MPIYNPPPLPPTYPPSAHHTTHETGGTDALTTLSAGIVNTGTLPDAQLSVNVAHRDQVNTFVTDQVIAGNPFSRFVLRDNSQAADARLCTLINSGQSLYVQNTNDAMSTVASTPLQLTRTGDAKVGQDLYEKGRTLALGHYQTIPYSAGNFSSNVGTWTVDAGDVPLLAYSVIGKTMWITFQVVTTSVTGSPTTLRIALPSGFTAANTGPSPIFHQNGGSTWQIGMAQPAGGGTQVNLYVDAGGTVAWATATNSLPIYGTCLVFVS